MFDFQSYIRILLSVSSGLLTLLGSVGIFVSLTVQRRIERLQDTLEQFMDLSYHNSANLTGQMFRLIEKYQMHYLLPDSPSRKILHYINLTIFVVVFVWFSLLVIDFEPPWRWEALLYLIPISTGLGILFFYRYLLKNAINPIDNALFTPLIPPPTKLRSVSFLSKYINVSVKTILKHARLRLVVKKRDSATLVVLKEELSFDDYFYYIEIKNNKKALFAGFGELCLIFPNEPITGKPVPVLRNINIPLGFLDPEEMEGEKIEAKLLIFPRGEKHPVEYLFTLRKQTDGMTMVGEPEISINYMILYHINGSVFELLENNTDQKLFDTMAKYFVLDRKRRWISRFDPVNENNIQECLIDAYVD